MATVTLRRLLPLPLLAAARNDEIDLAIGAGVANYLTSDLSYDYVRINADYRT